MQGIESIDDPTVETVLTLGPKITAAALFPLNALGPVRLPLVRREDRHEDGSISTTYYLDLTEDQYKTLGGA